MTQIEQAMLACVGQGTRGLNVGGANDIPQNDMGEEWEVFNYLTGKEVSRVATRSHAAKVCELFAELPLDYDRAGFSPIL